MTCVDRRSQTTSYLSGQCVQLTGVSYLPVRVASPTVLMTFDVTAIYQLLVAKILVFYLLTDFF